MSRNYNYEVENFKNILERLLLLRMCIIISRSKSTLRILFLFIYFCQYKSNYQHWRIQILILRVEKHTFPYLILCQRYRYRILSWGLYRKNRWWYWVNILNFKWMMSTSEHTVTFLSFSFFYNFLRCSCFMSKAQQFLHAMG